MQTDKDQTDKDQWVHIENPAERRRIQNMLAQRKYRRRKAVAEALLAAVASEDAQGSSPGHSSSLAMDGLEGRRSQEGSVISAASTKEGPADPVASCSSTWGEREMTVEKSSMAQLLNLPVPPTLASYYPIACSSLNRSVTTSQHCLDAQLAPGTLLPLEDQYNCGSSILPTLGTQAGAGQGEIDLSVSNFAGQFPGNVDLEYQTAYPWSRGFDEGLSTPVRRGRFVSSGKGGDYGDLLA